MPKSQESHQDPASREQTGTAVSDTGPTERTPADVVLTRLFKAAGEKKALTLNAGEVNVLAKQYVQVSLEAKELFKLNRHLMGVIQSRRTPRVGVWRRIWLRLTRQRASRATTEQPPPSPQTPTPPPQPPQ